jgi:hypothetical protein
MNRIPRILAGLAGLGLMLTACVPLDVDSADPTTSSSSGEPVLPPQVAASSHAPELPLQVSHADGLEQRIAALHKSSVAYQLQEGKHPVDYAVPGSERVLLAERFSRGMRFELPKRQSGDTIIVEMTCSEEINARFEAYDLEGRSVGSGQSSCSPDGPSGFGFGFLENRLVRQIEVSYVQESDVELSVTTFTSSDQEQASGN